MPNGRRPTQRDVAQAAGVSQAMVSYVLNDVKNVTILPATRKRVVQAINDLGYVPNRMARSLRSSKTSTIAAIIPDITNPFYPEFIRGIQDTARQQHYDIVAFNTDGQLELERHALEAARRAAVDGIILTPFFAAPADLRPILNAGTPVTLFLDPDISYPLESMPLDIVGIPGEDAAGCVVSYLLDRGHTRIGMISGQAATPPREARVRGYRRALDLHHVPLEEILIRGGEFTEEGGYTAMNELLQLSPRPTAVFAANDMMAMGALLACREQGVDVPGEIALAGFDDIPAARLVHPSLTTLNQHAHHAGSRAVSMLLSRLDETYTGPSRLERLGFTLIPRESA